MTRNCDQSTRVPAEHSSHLLVKSLCFYSSLLSLLLLQFLIEILTIITITVLNKFIKTHLCKVFNKLCKVCATAALNEQHC